MFDEKPRIKEFFASKKEEIDEKIGKTPLEKFFVFFLIVVTVSSLVLSYFQFKKNIEGPLYSSYLREERGKLREKYSTANLNINQPSAEITKMQSQDSDFDGLSDYSEVYLYKTNPYLEDSDGDGYWDKQEIITGNDPNCAAGQDCSTKTADSEAVNSETATNESAANINSQAASLPNLDLSNLVDLQDKLISGEVTLEQLGINDPQLQSMLDKLRDSNLNVSDVTPEEKKTALDALQNMSPAEIREELISRGLDEAMLNQIDDATLQSIFKQTIGGVQ